MKITKPVIALIIVALALAIQLTACGQSTTNGTPTTQTTTAPTATAMPQPAHTGQSADQIVQGLKAHGLPIGGTFTYNAANDFNKLLGRPGQYTGKTEFRDTRVATTLHGADINVHAGGSVEVFASIVDAQHRFTYVQTLAKSSSLFVEYDYLDGVAILRVSSDLTPDQAAAYEVAFKAV